MKHMSCFTHGEMIAMLVARDCRNSTRERNEKFAVKKSALNVSRIFDFRSEFRVLDGVGDPTA